MNLHGAKNYYDILEVDRSVDNYSLRSSFRRMSKALHPDTTTLPENIAARKFQDVCEAYEHLSDPHLRKEYDAKLDLYINKDKEQLDETASFAKNQSINNLSSEVRRPLSGGELFSLFLLILVLVLSFALSLFFALHEGRELQFQPSWLSVESSDLGGLDS